MEKKSEKVAANSLIGCEENPNNRISMDYKNDITYLFEVVSKGTGKKRTLEVVIREDIIREKLENIKKTRGNKALFTMDPKHAGKNEVINDAEKLITVVARELGMLVWFTRPSNRLITYRLKVQSVAA